MNYTTSSIIITLSDSDNPRASRLLVTAGRHVNGSSPLVVAVRPYKMQVLLSSTIATSSLHRGTWIKCHLSHVLLIVTGTCYVMTKAVLLIPCCTVCIPYSSAWNRTIRPLELLVSLYDKKSVICLCFGGHLQASYRYKLIHFVVG